MIKGEYFIDIQENEKMDFISLSWPNLIGKDGNEAVEIIKKESGMIIENNLYVKIFFILLRFDKCPYSATRFNGHHGLSNRSS